MSRTGGDTALIDIIYLGLSQMRCARNTRKALLVISDGIDNHSRYSAREFASAAVEADLQVHTIAIDELAGSRKGSNYRIAREVCRSSRIFPRKPAAYTSWFVSGPILRMRHCRSARR